MGRISKQSFRPHYDFVAVKRIKLAEDKNLEPGDNIPEGKFKVFHLRSLYQRRRIGVKGSEWAEAMIKAAGDAYARPEVSTKAPAPQKSIKPDIKAPVAEEIILPQGITIDRSGPGWIKISLDGEEIDKVRGDDALKSWLKENGYGE